MDAVKNWYGVCTPQNVFEALEQRKKLSSLVAYEVHEAEACGGVTLDPELVAKYIKGMVRDYLADLAVDTEAMLEC